MHCRILNHLILLQTCPINQGFFNMSNSGVFKMSDPTTQTFGAAHFDRVASTYEPPRSSNPMLKLAQTLISLAPPIDSTSVVHDNAAGPGIVTGEILQHHDNKTSPLPKLYASDISPAMIEQLKLKGWEGVEAEVMDSQDLRYEDGTFTHSFTSMGIFLFPDAEKGATEIYRTLRKDGVAVVSSIKKVGWVGLFQTAQKEVRPEAVLWKGPLAEEWSTKEKLQSVMLAGGFEEGNVRIETCAASMSSAGLGSFMNEFMREKMTALVTLDWSAAEVERFNVALARELKKAVEEPYPLEVTTWIAVSRK